MNIKVPRLTAKSLLHLSSMAAGSIFFGSVLAAQPDPPDSDKKFVCTNETIEGIYGFTITGMRPTGPGTPQVAIVGTALTTFNGDGTYQQFDNINVNSPDVPYLPNRPGSGTYTLNPDCSGTMTLTVGQLTLNLAIVVVEHGKEIRTAVVTPRVIITSNGRRI